MYTPKPEDLKRIANDFTYHAPIPALDQANRYGYIRAKAGDFARFLLEQCPSSRELSLALTNLEQAVFWANAAIARNEGKPKDS